MREKIRTSGSLKVIVYDEHNNIKDEHYYKNLVTQAGKAYLAARAVGNTIAVMNYMAVGSSNVAPLESQTALGSELGRVQLDDAASTHNTVAWIATFPAGIGTGTLREVGIFNSANGGSMMNKAQINIVKDVSDTIVITWNLDIL